MGKAEREHMGRIASFGCIVCINEGLGATPATAHHINCKTMGRKSSDYETIGLCSIHHQQGDGTAKYQGHIAVHHNLKEFERRYGAEKELLQQVLGMI